MRRIFSGGGGKRRTGRRRAAAMRFRKAVVGRLNKAAARNARLGRLDRLPLPFVRRQHGPFVGVRLSRHAHSPCHTPVAEGCLNPAFPVFVPTFIPLFARISQALDAQPANQGRIN